MALSGCGEAEDGVDVEYPATLPTHAYAQQATTPTDAQATPAQQAKTPAELDAVTVTGYRYSIEKSLDQ